MATWLLVLILIFSYLFIGAIIASVWERIERSLVEAGKGTNHALFIIDFHYFDVKIDYNVVCLSIIFWPICLLILTSLSIYLLIRKIGDIIAKIEWEE